MKWLIALTLSISSTCTFAGGYTQWAVPTRVDVIAGSGIMVYGAFGNAMSCTISDQFWVPISNPAYTQIYAGLLTAVASSKEIQIYLNSCTPMSWYTVETTTFGSASQGFSIRN